MTPAETLAMINENKVDLDLEAALFDNFYDKEEVDQKFYVARWRTDQISLFNPSVEAVAQPFVDQAKAEVMVEVEQVRTSLFADKTSILSDLAQTRAEVEVSIGNLKSTVESNKVNLELADIALQASIDQSKADLSISIAASKNSVLSDLADVRAEVLGETATNAAAITQAEADSNAYTDTKINDLLNGAGAAYDTLKELQDHIVSNDSDAAVELTNQIGIVQGQIDTNDTDITALQGRATSLETRATNLEGRATSLEAQDTTFQSDLNSLQASIDTLTASNTTLTDAYNNLLNRVTTLENTAYAEAGYVFP